MFRFFRSQVLRLCKKSLYNIYIYICISIYTYYTIYIYMCFEDSSNSEISVEI